MNQVPASTPTNNTLNPKSYRSLWILGWPVLINLGSHTLFSVVDLFWVHQLGTDAVAAVALVGNIVFCMFGLSQIIYVGALSMIARRIGARHFQGENSASSIIVQAFQLGLVLGILIAGTGALLSVWIISLFEVNAALENFSVDYLLPMMWSFLPLFPAMAIAAVFTASGNTRTPMYIAVAVNLLNAALDPFLIFGWANFPALGVMGAGIASLICQSLGLVLFILAFMFSKFPFKQSNIFKYRGISSWPMMLRIGIPSAAASITRPLSTLFLLKVIANFGTEGVAAFGITIRALSIIWLYHGALSTAVSTLCGQSLGRQDLDSIKVLEKNSIKLSLLLSAIFGSIYFFYAAEIIAIFEQNNAEVIALGVLFLHLLVIANLTSAPAIIWGAVLVGAGETRSPMFIAIQANWIIKLPLSWLFAIPFGWGIEGIWYAMFISIVYENMAIYFAYQRGKWKSISV